MSTGYRVALIAGGITLVLLFSMIASCVSFRNTAVKLESSVKAQYQSNQNTYDAFWKKVTEVAQVPDEYKEAFKDVLVADTSARYGKEGADATMLWIQERSINFDASLYKQLATIIEGGRNEFRQSQDDLLDKQRVYENHLNTVNGSLWAGFNGFPKVVGGDLAPPSDKDGDGLLTVLDYKIVTSSKTQQAFATGEDEALDVFGKKKEKG
jgi:hypothetical protein